MSEGGLRRLLALTRTERRRFAAACLLTVAGTALAVAPFLLAARILGNQPAAAADAGGADAGGLALALALAGCLLAQPVLLGIATGLAHHAAFDVLHAIRRDLMDKVTRLPLGYVTRRQAGRLKRTLDEDVEVLELFLSHQLPDVLACVVVPVATLLAVAVVDWRLALATLAVVPLVMTAQTLMMRGHGTRIGAYFGRIGAINGAAVEYVRGLETLKAMGRETPVLSGLLDRIDEFRRFAEDWYRLWGLPWSLYAVLSGAAPLFVVPLAVWLLGRDLADASDVVFCLFAVTGIGGPLVKMTIYGEITLRVLQAETRISALKTAPELTEPSAATAPEPQDSSLRFEHVSLDIDGRRLIDAASFTIPAGSLTAIVGPSGAGKSTLLRLAMRHADPDDGRVLLGGVDIRDLPSARLGRALGLVSQDVFLFDDTVAANLRLGRPEASDADLADALEQAACSTFIAALPQGIETRLGEGGKRLSGGQRQRLALARALVAGQSVLLLDEVSAFVDPWHESLLQRAVNRLVGRCTVVVVSHRLDSVAAADRIVFVAAGRVLAEGRHAELLAGCAEYARLWDIQQRNLHWRLRGGGPTAQPGEMSV